METERAGVFHLGSTEEVDDILHGAQIMAQQVTQELNEDFEAQLIRNLVLNDQDDLECFKHLEVSTYSQR
jgi:hypothetical protein